MSKFLLQLLYNWNSIFLKHYSCMNNIFLSDYRRCGLCKLNDVVLIQKCNKQGNGTYKVKAPVKVSNF